MLKHGAVTQFRSADAEHRGDRHDAETRTVSSQGRHSQERNSRG
jgi:hypothetical protein